MNLLDGLERRYGRLSFPGFLRYFALFHLLVYSLQLFRPDIGELLDFNRAKIFSGEIWRIATFPFASSGNLGVSPLGVLFFFFLIRIMMTINDALEEEWGVFRTSAYHYTCIAGLLAGNFLMPVALPFSGFIVYGSAFFAFATLNPRVVWHIFLVIPVEVRFLAMIKAAFLLLTILGAPLVLPFLLLGYANYLMWVVVPLWRNRGIGTPRRKVGQKLKPGALPDDEPFHSCAVCLRNDAMDPECEFRVGPDGREYCEEHIDEAEAGFAKRSGAEER